MYLEIQLGDILIPKSNWSWDSVYHNILPGKTHTQNQNKWNKYKLVGNRAVVF